MSDRTPATDDRLFRLCFLTVEYFGVALIAVYWILPFTGSIWGSKLHYDSLISVSLPVIVIVGASGLLTWRRYRKHALVHLVVVVAWAVWATMPRV
ncbi:MAG TPA: hypothetical protein VMS21_01860, partial [Methylomirabilota bacterium]|nr:hypothetical protein [Methylomirabilota bacterium]